MKTSQWIKDVKNVIGCEVPELFYVLAKIADREEDSARGLFARKCQSKILECLENVKIFLGEIRRNAQDFTLHDIQHCINVIDFMGQMLVDVGSLNPAEISFFIYAALLHDIGMVKLLDEDISLDDLREDHGERSARFIRERVLMSNDGNPFSFGEHDYIYMKYLQPICASHMQEFSIVEKLPQSYEINGMEVDMSLCAILLRLADAMDLKHNRAPYQLYKFIVNRSISEEHWKKHMAISSCQINEKGHFRVDGDCSDELTHRCLYNHLDMIESEIEKVFKWKSGTHPRLRINSHIIERNINPEGYKMWHHSFEMDVLKITNLFMGEQLYGDKKLGLREIIQNSIDACMVRDEMNKRLGTKQDYAYKPEIYIIFDRENNQVIIRDNGTGMNDYIIQNYFLNIGASYYSSNYFRKENLKYSPSGYFGIGFLACFMLSDDVYVRTAHWEEDAEYEFHFIKSDKFVTKTEKPKTFSGTEIRLNLDQFIQVFENHSNSSLTNENSYINDKIVDFIRHTFWDIEINQINKNIMSCSIRMNSFLPFIKENFRNEYNYNIDLSEYLKDFEGIIQLRNSDFFEILKCLTNISDKSALDALKNGGINISNNIEEIFPFIKHFYIYNRKENVISEITDRNNDFFSTVVLFPTKDSIINKKYAMAETIGYDTLEMLKEIGQDNFGGWNCLCLTCTYASITNINYYIDIHKTFLYDQNNLSITVLHEYLGYEPSFFLRIDGINDYTLSHLMYYNYKHDFNNNPTKTESFFWLNHAKIALPNFNDLAISFVYFDIQNITMRILNSLIKPDSSRKFIVKSSEDILKRAISVCIYLWVYDKIKLDKEAIRSTEYIRQLILEEWDSSIDKLLRSEKKPI